MKLSIRLFAALRERAGSSELVVDDLPSEIELGALKREIERRHPRIGSLAQVAGVVGTEYANDRRVVREGDEVALLPPVSGGSGGSGGSGAADDDDERLARGVFELSDRALDPVAAQARVAHDSCGAIATFTGTTRAFNREKAVVRLDYEAFSAMTSPEMTRIFERCRQQIADGAAVRMIVQHRVGTVEVGEPSVVIAVASAHRDAAFQACRFLIDELKRTLPIWKKEVYADGHHWIGDRS